MQTLFPFSIFIPSQFQAGRAASSSRLVQLHIIDVLFIHVASNQYDAAVQYLNDTRESIRFMKSQRK
ncbi:hypothetical protein [Paenibacillus sp. NAIST15-1]|uniref:hypothetical protein n=1 Tax=Paenibacillus sp. NAIST15-1 TaxID=1605994 RepID=UPI000933C108|nr:hypothetical protein [Paenibacillus sp. NAIST15-1]